ncbi:MAG: o-succinylbenzoate synthase [Gammaproteobacteria bacterium]|nr:o-succinylbenzoate synthase [Gammaproteobacteria bacterium]
MNIKQVELVSYTLPLKQIWQTSSGKFNQRQGLLIKLQTEQYTAYGDCAPLPQAGTETLEQAQSWLIEKTKNIRHVNAQSVLSEIKQYNFSNSINCPAAYCGLETALLDLMAQTDNISLARYLDNNAVTRIKVNANIGILQKNKDTNFLAEGFEVIKIKVGTGSVEQELKQIDNLVKQLPENILLRLDANGAWSYDKALMFIEGCIDFPVESIEEPVSNPQLKQLQQLQNIAPFIIAIDESLTRFDINTILDSQAVKRLVIKPMRDKGLLFSLAMAKQVYNAGMDCVITTTVDSAAGVWAATHLAAALGTAGENVAHGLATSDWLLENTGRPPEIINGSIILDGIRGLGFNEDIF